MALWQLGVTIRRHPAVVVVGVLLTCLASLWVHDRDPVYSADASVLFLMPPRAYVALPGANPLQGENVDLVALAGVVARRIGSDRGIGRSGSESVSLVGMGVRHGYSISLPNSGGQWNWRFRKAQLDIQAVGSSEDEVNRLLLRAKDRISDTLREMQSGAEAPSETWVVLQDSPAAPAVTASAGQPLRAAVAMLGLGLALTVAVAAALPRGGGRGGRRGGALARGARVVWLARPDAMAVGRYPGDV